MGLQKVETKNKILVVDDKGINRYMLGGIFREDYEVIEVSGGQEAIEVIAGEATSDDSVDGFSILNSPKEWTGLTIMDLQSISDSYLTSVFLVLLSDGSLWTWDGSYWNTEKIKSINGIVQKVVSSDSGSNAVITTDGALYMWGKNNYGQLGIGNLVDQNTPRLVTTFPERRSKRDRECYHHLQPCAAI